MESRKQLLWIIGVAISAVFLYALIRSCLENDESRIRKVIYGGAFAAEREDLRKCASFVSDAYEDQYGNDKAQLLKIALRIFKEFRELKIDIKSLKIETQETPPVANIGFKCYFKKEGQEQIYYDAGKLKIQFRK